MSDLSSEDMELMVQRVTGNKDIDVFGYYDITIGKDIWRQFYVQNATVLDYIRFGWKVRNAPVARLVDYEEDKLFLDEYLKHLKDGSWNTPMQEIFTFEIQIS